MANKMKNMIKTADKDIEARPFQQPSNVTIAILRALRLGWTPAAIAQLYGPRAGERALAMMLEMIGE